MATIKKVVAMSGEEYARLKQKAEAYDEMLIEKAAEEKAINEIEQAIITDQTTTKE